MNRDDEREREREKGSGRKIGAMFVCGIVWISQKANEELMYIRFRHGLRQWLVIDWMMHAWIGGLYVEYVRYVHVYVQCALACDNGSRSTYSDTYPCSSRSCVIFWETEYALGWFSLWLKRRARYIDPVYVSRQGWYMQIGQVWVNSHVLTSEAQESGQQIASSRWWWSWWFFGHVCSVELWATVSTGWPTTAWNLALKRSQSCMVTLAGSLDAGTGLYW
jgi:hypothetical protein